MNERWFEDILEEYLEAHRQPDKPRRIGVYFPSLLGYCQRRQFIDFHVPTKIPVRVLKIFFAGDMIQDTMMDKVLAWKFRDKHEAEVRVSVSIEDPETQRIIIIRGRIDGNLTEDGLVIPIEGKSQASHLYLKKKPGYAHLVQIYLYMVANGVPYSKLLYMERAMNPKIPEDCVTKTFKVMFNYDVWSQIRESILYLDECLRNWVLPPAEGLINKDRNWECDYGCQQCFICHQKPVGECQLDESIFLEMVAIAEQRKEEEAG